MPGDAPRKNQRQRMPAVDGDGNPTVTRRRTRRRAPESERTMSDDHLIHRLRVSIGEAFHHHHLSGEGEVDLSHVAAAHGVSDDEVNEQLQYLRDQNIIGGPEGADGSASGGITGDVANGEYLTTAGLAWAASGFPFL